MTEWESPSWDDDANADEVDGLDLEGEPDLEDDDWAEDDEE